MKRLHPLLLTATALLAASVFPLDAQCIRQDEFPASRRQDFGVYNVYDANAPKWETKLPAGYKAVGISHYGRHGSRYYAGERGSFLQVYQLLEQAAADSALNPRGMQVWEAYRKLYPALKGRESELSQLGREQHRGIARRMYGHYKPLFGSNSVKTAWSTIIPRCIESMGAFCEELARCDRRIEVSQEASTRYLSQVSGTQDFNYFYKKYDSRKARGMERAYAEATLDSLAFGRQIFRDAAARPEGLLMLEQGLWTIYLSLPSSDCWGSPECQAFCAAIEGGNDTPPLFDDAMWDQLRRTALNAHLVETCAPLLHHSTLTVFVVEAILSLAESDLQTGKPFVRLRFGHDTIVEAILKDMDIRGWRKLDSPEAREKEWCLSRIPMASNLQMVFYRKKGAPVLFKLMLNESELELPIEAVTGRIYDWEAFKAYMAPRIEKGKAEALPYLDGNPYPVPF